MIHMQCKLILVIFSLFTFTASAMATNDGIAASFPASREPLIPIPSLDVPRYMGTWYEIAKFPNFFQQRCVSDTHAEYAIREDRSIQVVNRCKLESGEMDEAIGVAKQLGEGTSSRLKVRFAPAWLSFIPAVWGDYWIIDLDDQYQLAAVSEPERKYLWVLSRTPEVGQPAYQSLLRRLEKKGLDVSKLVITRHGDASRIPESRTTVTE